MRKAVWITIIGVLLTLSLITVVTAADTISLADCYDACQRNITPCLRVGNSQTYCSQQATKCVENCYLTRETQKIAASLPPPNKTIQSCPDGYYLDQGACCQLGYYNTLNGTCAPKEQPKPKVLPSASPTTPDSAALLADPPAPDSVGRDRDIRVGMALYPSVFKAWYASQPLLPPVDTKLLLTKLSQNQPVSPDQARAIFKLDPLGGALTPHRIVLTDMRLTLNSLLKEGTPDSQTLAQFLLTGLASIHMGAEGQGKGRPFIAIPRSVDALGTRASLSSLKLHERVNAQQSDGSAPTEKEWNSLQKALGGKRVYDTARNRWVIERGSQVEFRRVPLEDEVVYKSMQSYRIYRMVDTGVFSAPQVQILNDRTGEWETIRTVDERGTGAATVKSGAPQYDPRVDDWSRKMNILNPQFADTVLEDRDGDTVIDLLSIDLNSDGMLDIYFIDNNQDNIFDQIYLDYDADGHIDSIGYDFSGDLLPDAWDTNFDGKVDGFDTNHDGFPDAWDDDNDGTIDRIDSNGDGAAELSPNQKSAFGNPLWKFVWILLGCTVVVLLVLIVKLLRSIRKH